MAKVGGAYKMPVQFIGVNFGGLMPLGEMILQSVSRFDLRVAVQHRYRSLQQRDAGNDSEHQSSGEGVRFGANLEHGVFATRGRTVEVRLVSETIQIVVTPPPSAKSDHF